MQLTSIGPRFTAAHQPNRTLQLGKLPSDTVQLQFGNQQDTKYLAELKKRGVLVSGGGGVMGRDIALNHLNAGLPVMLQDRSAQALENGRQYLQKSLAKSVQQNRITQDQATEKLQSIKGAYTADDFGVIPNQPGPAFMIEAVFEDFDVKKSLFQKLNAQLAPDAILATNTSSLSVDALAKASGRPDRFIGLHFFLPAHKNKLVEIVPSQYTSKDTLEKTKTLVRALGKTPIVCKDAPGFVVNRMLVPMMNEGVKMWEEMVRTSVQQAQVQKGRKLTRQEKAEISKRAATTIEVAAKEVLWPTFSKNPDVSGLLLGPFSGLNMKEYMGLLKEVMEILHNGLGNAYQPAKTLVKRGNQFNQLRRDNPPDFERKFQALQQPLGGLESVDQQQLPAVKDRFYGLLFGIAMQLVDQGITSPKDLDLGMQTGTRWELAPCATLNQMGTQKALRLVEAYAKTNKAFKVPALLQSLGAQNTPLVMN